METLLSPAFNNSSARPAWLLVKFTCPFVSCVLSTPFFGRLTLNSKHKNRFSMEQNKGKTCFVTYIKSNTDHTVTVITYITLVVASLSLGFWTGQRANYRTENPTSSKPAASSCDPRESTVDDSDSDDSSESNDGDVSALKLDSGEDCKMVSNIFLIMKISF